MKEKTLTTTKQTGFTLLESLVALFILTIGLLGVAGLQMQAMRSANVAKQRMLVVSYAEELIERIRANPDGVEDYAGMAASYGCSTGSLCNASEMAADDLFIWNADITLALPGDPNVTVSTIPVDDILLDPNNVGRIINVDISWTDRGDAYAFNSSSIVNINR